MAKHKPHFRKGTKMAIYQRPLTREDYEGKAELVRCIRDHTECFQYPGLIVEEWEVKFPKEETTYTRTLAVDSMEGDGD